MPDFFISYNEADREWAEWIAWQLEKEGFSTVLQAWDFRPGCNFVLEMQKATEDLKRTIAVLSPEFLASLFTKPEWAAAFVGDPTGEERKLLPVRVKECKQGGLLKALNYIDLVDLDEEAAKNALVAGVKLERAKPSSPPRFPCSHPTPPEIQRPPFPGALPPVWNMPDFRNPNFTGREMILTDLHDNLNSGQRATWIQALTGLGGKGKTSLAREYAYRYRAEYDLVWWVRASEPATLAMDYSDLAAKLDLPQKDSQDQNAIINAVKQWLGQNQKWLLIFDNAPEPNVVKRFLPQGGGGHVIITSRNPNWGNVAKLLQVEVFEPNEAVEFILKRTSQSDKASAKSLAEETGFLPLALEQVGAYMEETGVSLSDYLIRFKEHRKTALELGKPTDYPDTVATTWEISFQAIKEKSLASADLLNLCAFLAPDDIPKSLILGGSGILPEPLASSTADEFAFDEIVAELRSYSLISGTGDKFSVHQLVQAVTRDRLTEDEQENWSAVSVRLLNRAFQFDWNDVKGWEDGASLLPHVLASAGFAEELDILLETVAESLNNAGSYQQHLADFDEARKCLERALKINEKAFGIDHPRVARDVNNLGSVLLDMGEMEKARECFERALKIDEKAFGLDHPIVATMANNLGLVLRDMGEMEKAKRFFERALKVDEKAFGLEHPGVATMANNLGLVLRDMGEMEKARECFERALEIDEKVFGLEHPIVATMASNLGGVLQDLGEMEKARECFERALKIDEKVFGLEHPSVAIRANNLGSVLLDLGETKTARSCFKRSLRILQKFFGENHHLTQKIKANLDAIESLRL